MVGSDTYSLIYSASLSALKVKVTFSREISSVFLHLSTVFSLILPLTP